MEKANRTTSTGPDWYANELRSELSLADAEMGVNEIRVGDFLFFGYTARYPERDIHTMIEDHLLTYSK